MKRVLIYCEGPTEETFINRVLAERLYDFGIYVTAHPCGGVSKYSIIRRELNHFCKSDPTAIVTTMLDFYGLPSSTPGMTDVINGTIYDKIEHIETKILEDLDVPNLIPNIILHEYEALLFSKPECFSFCGLSERKISELVDIRHLFETPEHINSGSSTAPSKRIEGIYPAYSKTADGINIALDIGLDTIVRECKHFSFWLEKLKALCVLT